MMNLKKTMKNLDLCLLYEFCCVTLSFLSFSSFSRVDKRNGFDTCKSPLHIVKWVQVFSPLLFRYIPGAFYLSGMEPDANSDSRS